MGKLSRSFMATDWNDIAEYEQRWRELVRHPNAHPDFVKAVIESRPEVQLPVLIGIESLSPSNHPFMAIGRLEKAVLTIDIGYMEFFPRSINQLTIIHGGLIGTLDETTSIELLHQVRLFLKTKKAERVLIAGVRKDAPLWAALRKTTSGFLRDAAPRFTPHWTAALPSSWSEYEKKTDGKHRSYLRRCEKKIAEIAGGETRVTVYTRESDIDTLCRDAETIARGTYHRGIGAGFTDTPEIRRLLSVAAANGWMRGYVLYANNTALAFWLGTRFGSVFHLDFTGYLPDYSKQSPGLILFLKMIEDLYKTGAIASLDFGDGDAPYKQRFGDTFTLESDVILYAPTMSMLLYAAGRTIVSSFRRFVDRAVPKRLVASIKKHWRSNAVRKDEQQ
jgi:hypothetical protein